MSKQTAPRGRFLQLPSTGYGRTALRLFGISLALCLVLIVITLLHLRVIEPNDDGSPQWWLMIPMLATALFAGLAAVTGGLASVRALRAGDRSFVLALPAVAALIALMFVIGEFAVPH